MNIYCCCLHKVNKLVKLKMNLETCLQKLIKVNKHADSEFRIKKFRIWIFVVVVYLKYTNWWKLKMNLETCFQMLIKVNKYADSEFRI